ncbi:MAG TPA: lysozyme inhibitor LprI family protein [Candidatus Acidoferrales bacterium]|nr:lysozyme inhibitor LprI family protein [Candidatus Acidoferrales bacterium]
MPRLMPILAGVSLFLILSGTTLSQKRQTSDAGLQKSTGCSSTIECQKVAKVAFDAEMARIGKDCKNVMSQREEDSCQSDAAAATERNFSNFYNALEGIVGNKVLNESEPAWLNYRKKQCDAILGFFQPGTIAPSAALRCKIELTRSRMRDLDSLFETPLHH